MSFHFLYKSFRAFLAAVAKWFHETSVAVRDVLGPVHPPLPDTPQLQTAAQHRIPPLWNALTAVTPGDDGSAALEYNKGGHATGEGDRYEERMLALVFLRCVRHGLLFRLSANNSDAGKFDDLVLVWRIPGQPEAHTLLVQLKHKTSRKSMTIHSGAWLSEATNTDFGLSKYSSSYGDISKKLQMDRVTCVLLTNASLSDTSRRIFQPQDVDSVPGLELLQAGGDLYRLNPNNQQVWKAVHGNTSFVEHFYLLCHQRNSAEIFGDIFEELEELLGDSELCGSTCDRLCKSVREWMNEEKVWLTSGWRKWQQIVDEYVRKEVTDCIAVTTRLKYFSVANVRDYVESCNPAWVRPPESGTEALSATKIHQALAHQTHIMVDVRRYRVLRRRILHSWGRFCRWLVIIDDEQHGNFDILSELLNQTETERRLVIVSSETTSFVDTFQSSDISDDSWEECLDICVRLNGECYQCRLRDLVAGVDDLKSLLDGQPALLLALALLSQPLRMGQELETLPAYYMPRKAVDQWLGMDEILSAVGGIGESGGKQNKEQFGTSDSTNNVIIVEGRPGVGKSKMLSHVARKIKERDPGCWVLRVNLLEFCTLLDTKTSGASAVEGILKETLFNEDHLGRLEYILLRHILMESPRVVCLVDGFDEVCPDYVDNCLEVLPLLAPLKGKLVVTTRPAVVKILETQMGVSAHLLEPFNDSELEDFFAYHPSRGNITAISDLNDSIRGLLRIPLFAIMFVNLSEALNERCNIVTLYEAFFQNKFRRLYQEKWGDNLSAPGKKKEFEKAQKVHEEQLMSLAASVLISNTDVPETSLFDTDHFLNAGIVYEFTDGKPMFLHRTFAEHFLAKWCFTLDGEQKRALAYRSACHCGTMEFFLESFDRRAVMGHPLLEPLLEAVLGCDDGRVEALLTRGADLSQVDKFGRNALHLAAAHSTRRALPLLRRLCAHTDGGLLSAKDNLLEWTPREYASVCGCWDAEQVLLEFDMESCDSDKQDTMSAFLSKVEEFQGVQHNLDRLQDGDYILGLLEDFQVEVVWNDHSKLQTIFFWRGYRGLYQYVIQRNHPLWHYMDLPLWEYRAATVQIEVAESLISANLPYKSLSLIAEKAYEEGHTIVSSLLLYANRGRAEEAIKNANGRTSSRAICSRGCRNDSLTDNSSSNGSHSPSCAAVLPDGTSTPQGVAEEDPPAVSRCTDETATQHHLLDFVKLLHYGAALDDTNIVLALINLETDVRRRTIFGWTAMHFAAFFGSRECISLLRDAGVDLEAKCEDGTTALHLAAGRGHVESVRRLLEIGSVVDAQDPDGDTPLVYAVSGGCAECVRLLIAAGADVKIQDYRDMTLVHIAAEVGSAECIRLLADTGLSVAGRGGVGSTPLHTAASWGRTDCVRVLMALGASVHERDSEACTPLHLAAYQGHAECVKLLIDGGSDLHVQDDEGSTPLHSAVQAKHSVDCVRILLDASASITARDMQGDTPLHKAVAEDSVECVALLVAAGSDLQSKGRKSRTPLHHAARNGRVACAAFLLAEGADVATQDRHGNTALHVAAYHGSADVIPMLLQAGADRDMHNGDGVTALQLAMEGGYDDCVAALLGQSGGEGCAG